MSDEFALAVIGGGPAGLSAVRGYRAAGGTGAVALVTDEGRMPYQRPPLTKELLRGEQTEADLPLEDDGWPAAQDVALIGGRAVAIDPGERTIALSGGRRLRYRWCVLATGAEPARLPVPGADDPAVRVIRSLDQFRELDRRLAGGGPVVVVGSGFIGCEAAVSLRRRGHPVTLIADEAAPNEQRLGGQAAAAIAGWLADEGVRACFGAELEAIERDGERLHVRAAGGGDGGGGDEWADTVLMAVGVAPRAELLEAHGVELVEGAVPVDAQLRTELDGVLAAGDVCRAHNVAAGRAVRVEHWGDALAQGEVAGRVAAGEAARWDAVPGFWSTIGDRTLKHAAWGDGFDALRWDARSDGGFTAWYGRDGIVVGVLAHRADGDYDRGRRLVGRGAPWPP